MGHMRLPDNIVTQVFPRPVLWFSALCTSALGVVLLAGAAEFWLDAEASLAWPVMLFLFGLLSIAMAAVVVIAMLYRPRNTIETLVAWSADSEGITLYSSRRADKVLLIAIIIALATAIAGAIFATGGWRIAVMVLVGFLILAFAGATTALRRPRWLRLRPDGIESAALRSHTEITWRGLAASQMKIESAGGGQMIARLRLPRGASEYREWWHNRLEIRREAVDVEYMMTGVDGEALIRMIIDAITLPEVRSMLESDKERLLRILVDPPKEWPADQGVIALL